MINKINLPDFYLNPEMIRADVNDKSRKTLTSWFNALSREERECVNLTLLGHILQYYLTKSTKFYLNYIQERAKTSHYFHNLYKEGE